MSAKNDVKDKIDHAADKAKDATEKVADKAKDAAHKTGEKLKDAGPRGTPEKRPMRYIFKTGQWNQARQLSTSIRKYGDVLMHPNR